TVYSGSLIPRGVLSEEENTNTNTDGIPLDDEALKKIRNLRGVDLVLPDIRFPAAVNIGGREKFSLIQVIPMEVSSSKAMQFRAGQSYTEDEKNSVIISDSLLVGFKIKDFASMIGKRINITTLTIDLSRFNPEDLSSLFRGDDLPFAKQNYEMTIAGVAENMGFGGPALLKSDVYLSPETASGMKKLPVTNLWDLLREPSSTGGYSLVNVRLSSPDFVDSIKKKIEDMGFRTFALIDQFEEFQKGFLFMDLFLLALGMIAVVVASLGIINTMIMSIMERYSEIGIMKAVGASNRDIQKIFFFETISIGFLGGLFGLGLGWGVSLIINKVVNIFLSKQGLPYLNYFSFPLWVCLGAVGFAIVISLIAGIYPAARAARVDPVVALRHN
ncbi:MAG: FtsX-like permease family protein, partial [Candidatus Aminicenantes bacterium]|nr:FtsX-like permease family protein [Candidatus Aminicenantes bacterium]